MTSVNANDKELKVFGMSDFGFKRKKQNLVWKILLFPITILKMLAVSSGHDGMESGPKGVGGWLYLIFVAPFVWMGQAFVQIFVGWSGTRRGVSFLYGIPALLFGLGILGVFTLGALKRNGLDNVYSNAAKEAERSQQFTKAALYLDRAIRENPTNSEYIYRKGKLKLKEGKRTEAYRLFNQIANTDVAGFAPAHLDMARSLKKNYAEEMKKVPEHLKLAYQTDVFKKIEQHLKLVVNGKFDKAVKLQAKHELYSFYLLTRRLRKAAPLVDELVEYDATYGAVHYDLYKNVMKNETRAESVGAVSAAALKAKIIKLANERPVTKKAAERNLFEWKRHWEIFMTLEVNRRKFDELWRFQNQFLTSPKISNNKKLLVRVGAAMTRLRHAEYLKSLDPMKNRRQRLTYLSQALRLRPGFPAALIELVDLGFADVGKDSDQWIFDAKADANPGDASYYAANILLGMRSLYQGDDKTAAEYFESAKKLDPSFPYVLAGLVKAVEGDSKVTKGILETLREESPEKDVKLRAGARFGIQSMLANHAVKGKDFPKAVKFFRQACEINPDSAQSKNNLAFCLIHLEDAGEKEWKEALELVNKAIVMDSTLNNFFETRGNIHMRLKNYRKAVEDFEKALDSGYKRPAKIWPLLAEANRKIGRDKEAAAFQRKWDALPEETRKALKSIYYSGNNEKLLKGEKPTGASPKKK